jgi:atypical dual specificity phosphatase
VPTPGADADQLDSAVSRPPPLPEPARRYVRQAAGPRGFLWLKQGALAGTPRPGIVADLEHDLAALKRVGVTVLMSLTQTPVDSAAVQAHGMRHIAAPIRDMRAPTVAQARELCVQIESLIAQGEVVAVHCRAGLGRTGTILASHLIWEGRSALDALETVRRIEPKWVQSDEQVWFLEEFACAVANEPPRSRSGAVQAVPQHSQ